MLIPELRPKDINRFWSKVNRTTNDESCWEWIAGKRRRGYGRFTITVDTNKDKGFVSTRVAYFIHTGVDPNEKCVLHTCDNPSCVNPNHLFLGTNKDNTEDMMSKGRGIQPLGSKCGRSKIKEEDVLKIRELVADGKKQNHVASLYGIDQSAVSNIIRGRNWGWL